MHFVTPDTLAFFILILASATVLLNMTIGHKSPLRVADIAAKLTGISLLVSLIALSLFIFTDNNPVSNAVFEFSPLTFILSTLLLLVSFIIHHFSRTYLLGDSHYPRFFFYLSLLTISALTMVFAANLVLMGLGFLLSNLAIALLMMHKKQWLAAKNSGLLALKTLLPASILLIGAALILYLMTGSFYLQPVSPTVLFSSHKLFPLMLIFILLSACMQSALWPFHRWLLSSLNSPTPVSAMMHAGLINGGGILIIKCALLVAKYPYFLQALFVAGAISALLGTCYKLVQTDAKRMLACSTMAQMGYMMMQCGLGLFPAATAHLCFHGLFKSYLFLNAGTALQSVKKRQKRTWSFSAVVFCCMGGLTAVVAFALAADKSVLALNADTWLLGFIFLTGMQLTHALSVWNISFKPLWLFTFTSGSGLLYGLCIRFVESLLPAYKLYALANLNSLHFAVFALFALLWLYINTPLYFRLQTTKTWKKLYVSILNASQPHPDTITACRSTYQY